MALSLHTSTAAMMKTIAIVLFSAFAATACATDDGDLGAIDKPGIDQRKSLELDADVAQWAQQHVSGPRGYLSGKLDGAVGEWAQELIRGPRDLDGKLHGAVGDFAEQSIRGPRSPLDGKLGGAVGQWAEGQVPGPRTPDGTVGGDVGEWAEEILIDNKSYTLVHGPRGVLELIEQSGTIIVSGRLSKDLPK